MTLKQLYRHERDVIDAVDGADWMQVYAIEDVVADTERRYDEALWDGDDALAITLRQELDSLSVAVSVGEKYVTNW